MLGIQFYVQIDAIEVVPVAQNVINELDSIAKPLGIVRYTGEKSKHFKSYANQIAEISFDSPEEQHKLLALEMRNDFETIVFEQNKIDDVIVELAVLNSFELRVKKFTRAPGSTLFLSTTTTYDLTDRTTYPFLEDVLAHININIEGLYTYLTPIGQGRNNHLLPYHLAPVQHNYFSDVTKAEDNTSFLLNHKYIIPDSIEFNPGSMPDEELKGLQFVNAKTEVLLPGDIYVDYWSGEVLTGSVFAKYDAFFSYRYIKTINYFIATPGSAIFSYNDSSLLTRLSSYDIPNGEILKHKYKLSAADIQDGFSYNGSRSSSNLVSLFDIGKLHENNKNRWG